MSNFGDLDIFVRVVGTGSMSAAGRELGLSPAVVSKRLRRLEDRLGSRLLQRTTRQISLTDAGQGFYERAVAILASIEEAETFVTKRSSEAQGTLKVTAPAMFGRMHIARHLGRFMASYEDLAVNIVLDDQQLDIVGEGFDLAVRIGELPDSSLVARKLADVRYLIVAAPAYVERHGMPRTPADLEDHSCVPSDLRDPWKLVGPNGQKAQHRPSGPLHTNSSEVVRECVMAGTGIGLRPLWEVGEALSDGTLVRILPDWEGESDEAIHAVYPSRRFLPAKVRLFIDFLAQLYANPAWDAEVIRERDQIGAQMIERIRRAMPAAE